MINSACVMGRLVADPELRKTSNGTSVSSFTIAVDRRYNKEEKITDFLEIVCWKQQAEFVCKYFSKGSMIGVEGSLQSRNFEDRNGIKRKVIEIVAQNISFCGDRKPADRIGIQFDDAPRNEQNDFKEIPDFDETDVPF